MTDTQAKLNNRAAYYTYGFIELSEPPASYDDHTWALREQEYIEVLNSIVLPVEMGADDLQALNAIIDHTQTIALIESGIMQRSLEYFRFQLKILQQQYFNPLKQDLIANDPTIKRFTEAEINSAIQAKLNTEPFNAITGAATVYDLYFRFYNSNAFMQAIIEALKEKKEKLITNAAAMKILAEKPNVYTIQQQAPDVRQYNAGGLASYPAYEYSAAPYPGYIASTGGILNNAV